MTKKRVRDPEAKRVSLLDAGMRIADEFGMAKVSVNDVAATADVGKGSFYVHFVDRSAFLLELHRGFHEALLADIRARTGGRPAGLDRLSAAGDAFLDHCLRARTVRALLVDIRGEMDIADEVATRTAQVTRMFEQDLRAAGWPDPGAAARLYMAMLTETGASELSRGRREPALRRSLLHFLSRGGASAARSRR